MALTTNSFTYAGGAQTFTLSLGLGYDEASDISIYVVGELDGNGDQIYRSFTFDSEFVVRVTASLDVDDVVVVERTVSQTTQKVDFETGGDVTPRNLQLQYRHIFSLQQELLDGRVGLLNPTVDAAAAVAAAAAAAVSAAAAAADEILTDADATATAADAVSTAADLVQTDIDQVAAAASASAAAADEALTDADATATAADVVSTNADVVTTNADVVSTGDDATATAADAVSTDSDATAAAASAAAAALEVANLSGTSTTSLLIEVAEKIFTTQANKSFAAGAFLLVTSDADPTNFMFGQVTTYSSTTLTLGVISVGGSGTLGDWTIRVCSTRGAVGAQGDTGDTGPTGPLANIVEDTTPELGGNLDVGAFTVDGRDVAADGTKLDAIEAAADVTDAGNVAAAGAQMLAETTAAEWRNNTADKLLSTDQVWSAAAEVTLTDDTTIAVDMDLFINAKVTLTDNRTLGNPTNEKVGQSGYIRIIQDAGGTNTLAYGTDWEFAGGSAPVLATGGDDEDILHYVVLAANRILGPLSGDIA